MTRYFIKLAYNGANFCGWQIQPNAPSVQQELEEALTTLLHQKIAVTGCGRTDAGVHAKYFVAHFDADLPIENSEALAFKLNSFLSGNIVIFSIHPMHPDAHARFDATARAYQYHIITRKDPFLTNSATRIKFHPNFDKMNEAALLLHQFTDFTSFSKLHTDVKTNNCTVTFAQWQQVDEHHWVFHISANRFLRNMVRAIVGTLLEVGKGKIGFEEFVQIIEAKDRGKAGTSVPAHGLYLTDVKYPYSI